MSTATHTALPLPFDINGRRYMDAGPHSGTSAQLAAGHDLVVVIAVAVVIKPGARPALQRRDFPCEQDGNKCTGWINEPAT